jgi:hypothetical protein
MTHALHGTSSTSAPLAAQRPSTELQHAKARGGATREALFDGVFLGGFECSCHKLDDGRRLDLLASTRHLELVEADYARLRQAGMTACRDGVPWALAERAGGVELDRFTKMLHAAERQGLDVIWDLMHFGWPDDVDPFSGCFPTRFGRYAAAFARWFAEETDGRALIAPVNEMSFLAWAGGDVRCMNPFEAARGVELKAQLARATIEAIEAIRSVLPHARFLQPEPIINIVPSPKHPLTWARVASDNLLQFQAWDMLTGRVWPSLGGAPRYLDIIGVNIYPNNQFMPDGTVIARDDVRYQPLARMLLDVWQRYERPMIVSETGSEGDERQPWLRYVVGQCVSALHRGCELHGVTLYPILDHPGWVDGRHCPNGLFGYADERGERVVEPRLLAELQHQRTALERARARMLRRSDASSVARASEA